MSAALFCAIGRQGHNNAAYYVVKFKVMFRASRVGVVAGHTRWCHRRIWVYCLKILLVSQLDDMGERFSGIFGNRFQTLLLEIVADSIGFVYGPQTYQPHIQIQLAVFN